MNKIFKTLILLLVCFLLLGCNVTKNDNDIELSSLKIVYSNKVVSWNKIEGTDQYILYSNDSKYLETTELMIDISDFYNGTYSIYVLAVDINGITLKKSNNLIITITDNPNEPVKSKANVLFINDTHGSFISTSYPGIGKVGSLINSLENKHGEYIKISNGDIFQGSYASNVLCGLPLVEALNNLEFDCFVLGNHDFDWGLDKIAVYKDLDETNGELHMPVLGANIIEKKTNDLVPWVDPYTVIENNGVKVGIIGLIGETLESTIFSDYVSDYEFLPVLPVIKKYSNILRTEKLCDLVLVSIHDYDTELNEQIANLSGNNLIDGILCGHTHQRIKDELNRSDGKKILALQNYDKNEIVTSIFYNLENGSYSSSSSVYYYPDNYSEDSRVLDLYSKYQYLVDEGNVVIGNTQRNIYRDTLGSYCIEGLLDEFGCDVAAINTAGVRESLYAGDITVEKVYQIYPFNNEIILVSMTGSKIKNFINSSKEFLYYSDSYSTLQNYTTYTLAVVDYVYYGVYYKDYFRNTTPNNSHILMRDILKSYLDNLY